MYDPSQKGKPHKKRFARCARATTKVRREDHPVRDGTKQIKNKSPESGRFGASLAYEKELRHKSDILYSFGVTEKCCLKLRLKLRRDLYPLSMAQAKMDRSLLWSR